MQTLGVSTTATPAENRFKTLFWPSIRSEVDVDHISRQGFWLCTVVAVLTIAVGAMGGVLVLLFSTIEALFYFLAGIGIRQRSRFAAVAAFTAYTASSFILPAGTFPILRVVMIALLLANVRGTWLSAKWQPGATEPPPLPPDETWKDKLSGAFPIRVWPVARWFLYAFAAIELLFLAVALAGV